MEINGTIVLSVIVGLRIYDIIYTLMYIVTDPLIAFVKGFFKGKKR